MSSIQDVIAAYVRLRDECDGFFRRIQAGFVGEMACREGCDACCSLSSVTHLEGGMISDYLRTRPTNPGHGSDDRCRFLKDGLCTVYPVRPLICRTHGLMLFDSETNGIERSCDLNFPGCDVNSFDVADALDVHRMTGQLIRLNILYCHFSDIEMSEDGRIPLVDLLEMT